MKVPSAKLCPRLQGEDLQLNIVGQPTPGVAIPQLPLKKQVQEIMRWAHVLQNQKLHN